MFAVQAPTLFMGMSFLQADYVAGDFVAIAHFSSQNCSLTCSVLGGYEFLLIRPR